VESQSQKPARTTALKLPTPASELPIRLGIASYTFRNFDSTHLIDFMHQLKTPYLNLKDVHLPMTPLANVAPMAGTYRAAGFQLTAAGSITFDKDEGRRHLHAGLRTHASEPSAPRKIRSRI
jgi:hypothetical protein